MTKAAAHFGKRMSNFFANQDTQEYIDTLVSMSGIPAIELIQTLRLRD